MRRVFFKSLLFVLLLPLAAAAQDFLPELVKRIKPSAVAIEAFDSRGQTIARGSGFFVGADRIITNRHVIEGSYRAEVHLLNDKRVPVKGVLAVDGEGDLALLQVDLPQNVQITPLPLVRRAPQEGESIVVIGNPFGLEGSVSNGIVSAVREIPGYGKIIQITGSISPGSSGSPVVNMAGQVIGVATLQAEEGQNLNFAVPAARILQLKVGDARTFSELATETQKNKRVAAQRLYSQGLAQLSTDDFARALPYFQKAADIDPTYAEAWYQAGYCFGLLGRHAEALKASRQAAKLRPDWAATYVNIGASSFALGQFKDAYEAYRNAVGIDANDPQTQFALGLTLDKLNRTGEAIINYRRALELKTDLVPAMENLGLALFKQKRYAEAADAFEQLKVYRPDARTYNYIGECLLESGKAAESIDAFNTAIGYSPDMDKARYNLGRAYIQTGNVDMATAQYNLLRDAKSEYADRLLVLIKP